MERLPLKRRDDGDALVERANSEISIYRVLRDLFDIDVPGEGTRSYKSWCPFGFEHPDGGVERTWRTYPATNSSYCFNGHGFMPPVRLVSIQKGWPSYRTARYLLEIYGLLKQKNYRERYDEMVVGRETRQESLGAAGDLVEALHVALKSHPGYVDGQYGERFQQEFGVALAGLDGILSGKATEVAVREWFAQAREKLWKVLDGGEEELDLEQHPAVG